MYLFKLVYSEDAPSVTAVRPHLLSEARREAGVPLRQVLGLHPLVPVHGTQRLLTGGYKVLLLH